MEGGEGITSRQEPPTAAALRTTRHQEPLTAAALRLYLPRFWSGREDVRGWGRARSGQEEGRGRTPEGGRCRKEVGGRREKSSRRSPVTAAAAEMSSETLRPFGLRKQVLVSSHSKRRNSGPNSGILVSSPIPYIQTGCNFYN
jgi:hypothetical protein